jgi:hypothetical protein
LKGILGKTERFLQEFRGRRSPIAKDGDPSRVEEKAVRAMEGGNPLPSLGLRQEPPDIEGLHP